MFEVNILRPIWHFSSEILNTLVLLLLGKFNVEALSTDTFPGKFSMKMSIVLEYKSRYNVNSIGVSSDQKRC